MAEQSERINFIEFMRGLRSGDVLLRDCPEPVVSRLCEMFKATADKLEKHFAEGVERERNSPGVGALAPDFSLERLDAGGGRTGQVVNLRDSIGKPVALIFGSYT